MRQAIDTMRYRLLGPLEITDGQHTFSPSAPRLRTTLALLLVKRGAPLGLPEVLEELWGTQPPRCGANTVQVFVMRLRRLLAPDVGVSHPQQILRTTPAGYSLRVDPGQLDICGFDDLVAAGGQALEGGDPAGAARILREALELWRGCPLSDVPTGLLLRGQVLRLGEAHLSCVELRIEADLRLGRHRELVGELQTMVSCYPLRETFQRQLMLALYRCDRQAEALEVYRRLRQSLVDDLGVEPGAQVRRLHHAILSEDPDLLCHGGSPRSEQMTIAVPMSNLPTDIADFVGRCQDLAAMRTALTGDRGVADCGGAVRLVAISGPAGVGKSTLAVHAAHLLRPAFPDGQFYVNLRDAAGRPVTPEEVLCRVLYRFGWDSGTIPGSLEERSALYRSRFGGRKVLVILDNAADEAQVRPLLPAGQDCAVLVTSRCRLSGLEGAVSLDLPVFSRGEAGELLARLAGRRRVAADPLSADQIAQLCGLLPLAVRAAGAKLAAKPHWTLADLAARLADNRRRLCELKVGDLDPRASFAASYRACEPAERHLFRLLAIHPGADFPASVAAAAAEADLVETETALERLVDMRLLRVIGRRPRGEARYGYLGLLRDYAAERLDEEEAPGEHEAALRRMVEASARLELWPCA
ncbi:MAG TPA: BTAD domain-containing putative transcriptional regulator [Candidatus Limnocylindrales bacterium]|nr:BTAD domain-containing putative transcriptional regulator [Candidatus Limnocylindrales bacterium]